MKAGELLVLFFEDKEKVLLQVVLDVFFMTMFFALIVLSNFLVKNVRK